MSDIELGRKAKKEKRYLDAERIDPSGLIARGHRLLRVRKLMGLTRDDFRDKYGISDGTLRGWEEARMTGLTEKNVTRLLPVFEGEAIQCSLGWLLHGEGTSPLKISNLSAAQRESAQDAALQAEIEVFCKYHPDAVYIRVEDDGMEPQYCKGDYVAGERLYQKAISSILGQHCIIETQMGEILLRIVREGTKQGKYTLQCSNLQSQLPNPIIYDAELLSAAPVIWHRRIPVWISKQEE